MKKNLGQIAKEDGRFSHKAVRFVYEGLGQTIKRASDEPGHVSGQILTQNLKKLAVEKWGRLAMLVLNSWGVKTTRDFGEIVYMMIQNEWMSAQPSDTIEDFDDLYDFKTVFKEQFTF
ncbi:Minf_1886 family protein [Planctomycetota bacterium]